MNKTITWFIFLNVSMLGADTLKQIFTHIYITNFWNSKETVSGGGSQLFNTEVMRTELPKICVQYRIKKLLDASCGDFWWMKEVDVSMIDCYVGVDIVDELIEKNNKKYKSAKREFVCLDIVNDNLPLSDCILCRDCLVHLTFDQIFNALINFKKSGSKYILLTTYPHANLNADLSMPGGWRQLNFQKPPFNFPDPEYLVSENYRNRWGVDMGKYIALWDLELINIQNER